MPAAPSINRPVFFDAVRPTVFGGHITADQVAGCVTILDAWKQTGHRDLRWLAYILGTTFHEVAGTMQPIKERGGDAYFHRMHDIEGERPNVARTLGNIHPGDGVRFAGRGYVQLTGRSNYERASEVVGADLTAAPDLALRPDIAATILIDGMVDGWFTGRRLAHYFSDTAEDWINARRIVNGLDRAGVIAGYARQFHEALLAGVAAPSRPQPAPTKPVSKENPFSRLLKAILNWLRKIFP